MGAWIRNEGSVALKQEDWPNGGSVVGSSEDKLAESTIGLYAQALTEELLSTGQSVSNFGKEGPRRFNLTSIGADCEDCGAAKRGNNQDGLHI